MKNKKKKKVNAKKIIAIIIVLAIILIGGFTAYKVKSSNDEKGVFSVLEKRWIEKNKSTVIDVSILNDIPIFGSEGEGVFFDFLDDFSKETGLEFNKIPYISSKSSKDSGYVFEINQKKKLDDNELLMYTDNVHLS